MIKVQIDPAELNQLKKALVKDYEEHTKKKLVVVTDPKDGRKLVEADFMNYILEKVIGIRQSFQMLLADIEWANVSSKLQKAAKK